jgi:hypothetical protein
MSRVMGEALQQSYNRILHYAALSVSKNRTMIELSVQSLTDFLSKAGINRSKLEIKRDLKEEVKKITAKPLKANDTTTVPTELLVEFIREAISVAGMMEPYYSQGNAADGFHAALGKLEQIPNLALALDPPKPYTVEQAEFRPLSTRCICGKGFSIPEQLIQHQSATGHTQVHHLRGWEFKKARRENRLYRYQCSCGAVVSTNNFEEYTKKQCTKCNK